MSAEVGQARRRVKNAAKELWSASHTFCSCSRPDVHTNTLVGAAQTFIQAVAALDAAQGHADTVGIGSAVIAPHACECSCPCCRKGATA